MWVAIDMSRNQIISCKINQVQREPDEYSKNVLTINLKYGMFDITINSSNFSIKFAFKNTKIDRSV